MNPLLLEGLADAIGFIGGALLGYWLGRPSAWTSSTGLQQCQHRAIVLVGLGGGVGLQLARRWRLRARRTRAS